MAVGSDGLVLPVAGPGGFELVDVLADQITFNTVACEKGKRLLQDFELS